MEGVSKLPQVSSEPGLDVAPSHIALNCLQTYVKGEEKATSCLVGMVGESLQRSLPGLPPGWVTSSPLGEIQRFQVFSSAC